MNELSGWIIGILFVAAAIAFGLLPARLFRWRHARALTSESKLVASDLMARVGALHGLILALVFASTHGGNEQLQTIITQEATAVDHVYYNARRYGAPEVMAASTAYIRATIDQDWPSMANDNALSSAGWRAWSNLLEKALELTPENARQAALLAQIQQDVWRIENLRQTRGYEADNRIAPVFWLVAITGIVLVGALLFAHEPTPLHQLMMSAYSAYTGLVLFLIYDLTHPFDGAIQIRPVAFQAILDSIMLGQF